MRPINHLVQPHIGKIEPYLPGTQPSGSGWIKLNTNELPFSPPEEVRQAILGELDRLARYPNPRSEDLRHTLAGFYGLAVNQVIIGNGSDDILNLLARAFGGKGRETVDTFPSYSLYAVLTAIAGGRIRDIPFAEDFQLPVEALVESRADLVFLTSPNAPSGVQFSSESLSRLASRLDGLLVIDEAYVEFAEDTALPLLGEFENVFITRTFSKAYGLAGLRVGYGLGSSSVISILDRIRDSYNVNRLSQAGAMAAIKAQPIYLSHIKQVKETRNRVREALIELGWKVYPSKANFLFGSPVDATGNRGPEVAAELFSYLEGCRILVRTFPKHPLTASFLRISIGTTEEMEIFLERVKRWTRGA